MARRTPSSSTPQTHDVECDEPGCGFTSTGWATKRERDERAKQHRYEHSEGVVMPELAEFREAMASGNGRG